MQRHANLQLAVITGDLNWDDESRNPADPELLPHMTNPSWKDAWVETHGPINNKNRGYTYDGKDNVMLSNSLRRRFDRCLTLSRTSSTTTPTTFAATKAHRIGQRAIPGLTFEKKNPYNNTSRSCPVCPSDHFGLVFEFDAT